MSTKLGFHILMPRREPGYDDDIAITPLPVLKVVGNPEEVGILRAYAASPVLRGAILIGRIYDWDKEAQNGLQAGEKPEAAADRFVEHLAGLVNPGWPDIYWECGPNEPPDNKAAWINRYYAYIIPKLAAWGIRSVAFNFSVCHPEFGVWAQLGDALRVIRGVGPGLALIGLHQYGLRGTMQDYSDSRALRHRAIPEIRDLKKVITEGGLDEPGWRKTGLNAQQYIEQLIWWDVELAKDPNVLGVCLYTLDNDPAWNDFSLVGPATELLFKYMRASQPAIVELPPVNRPPAPVPAAKQWVTTGSARLRAGPGMDQRIFGVLPKGTPIEKTGMMGDWIEVKAFVHKTLVKEK